MISVTSRTLSDSENCHLGSPARRTKGLYRATGNSFECHECKLVIQGTRERPILGDSTSLCCGTAIEHVRPGGTAPKLGTVTAKCPLSRPPAGCGRAKIKRADNTVNSSDRANERSGNVRER